MLEVYVETWPILIALSFVKLRCIYMQHSGVCHLIASYQGS